MATPQLPAFLQQTKSQLHATFIDLEWQQRNRLLQGTQPSDTPSPFARLTGEEITARNRYLNVEPFAENRVKLRTIRREGENGEGGVEVEGSDYINASPIVLGKRRYIATQGPKDTSVNHFYRMLAQECSAEGPAVVVMLTQTHEAGREKCFQYYPLSAEESPLIIADEDGEGRAGEVNLESVEMDGASRSEVRRMRLRMQTHGQEEAVEEKEIHHLLFSAWPDFLIPEGEDRDALIQLVHLSNRLNDPSTTTTHTTTNATASTGTTPTTNGNHSSSTTDPTNPRIIHCSAGVGRSGTFIALDYLLSLLHMGELDKVHGERDLIAETVDLLRQQRMMMVQGEQQFNFLYEVLRDVWGRRAAGGI